MSQRMVIDFHDHPSPAVAQRQTEMGIDCSVLLSVGRDALERATAMAQAEPGRYVPFYWIGCVGGRTQPLEAEPGALERAVAERGVRGVKFQPMDQHLFADDRRLYPVYETCQSLGLVCTWHAGVVNLSFRYELGVPMLARYTNPMPLDRVAFDFPQLKLCIAHLGGNYSYEAAVLAEKHENVYLDTAFLPFFAPRFMPPVTPEQWIAHVVGLVGAEKVLFGSEGLHPDAVRNAGLSPDEKDLVLGGNAQRLLGL